MLGNESQTSWMSLSVRAGMSMRRFGEVDALFGAAAFSAGAAWVISTDADDHAIARRVPRPRRSCRRRTRWDRQAWRDRGTAAEKHQSGRVYELTGLCR